MQTELALASESNPNFISNETIAAEETKKEEKPSKNEAQENQPGLSYEQMSELLQVTLDVNPKNVHLNMNYDPEPILEMDVIVKMTFISFESALMIDLNPRDQLDYSLENFSHYRYPPPPQVEHISNVSVDSTQPFIKKSFIEKGPEKNRLVALGKRAFGEDCVNHYKFKPTRWVLTQRMKVKLGQPSIIEHMDQFPHDRHHIRLHFGLVPAFLYSKSNRFQFCLPVDFTKFDNSGARFKSELKGKAKFYLTAAVKPFSSHAHMQVQESILDFDIKPFSMIMQGTDPKAPGTPKISAVLSFTLVRHVMGVAMTLLLPIYSIALVTPVCWFQKEFDNIAAFLATLLLTLVAHRSVIAERTAIVQRFTTVDHDFVTCLLLVIVQLIISLIFDVNGYTGQSYIETADGGELATAWCAIIEWAVVVLWCTYRWYRILSTAKEVGYDAILDLVIKREPLTYRQYKELARSRKTILYKLRHSTLYKDFYKNLKTKTFFSTNLKLLLSKANEKGFHSQTSSVPMNDLFRMRVHPDEAAGYIRELVKHDFHKFYTKKMTDSVCKIVFLVEDSNLKTPLELQITALAPRSFDKSHQNYKREMLYDFIKNNRRTFHIYKAQLRRVYYRSCIQNFFRCRWSAVTADRELYKTMNAVIERVDEELKVENEGSPEAGLTESFITKRDIRVDDLMRFIDSSIIGKKKSPPKKIKMEPYM